METNILLFVQRQRNKHNIASRTEVRKQTYC